MAMHGARKSEDDRRGEPTTSGIYHCLVRYGSPGHVARFGSIESVPCRRGDRVIVHTDRGIEVGEVLSAPQEATADEGAPRATGELLRPMTPEDQRHEESLGDAHLEVLRACRKLLVDRQLPVTVIDAEQLFDGRTIILYYLGEPTEKLGPVAVELGRETKARVQFKPVEPKGPDAEIEPIEPADEPPAKRSKAEQLKESSRFLRGTIAEELARASDKFSSDDASLLKFHGIYQQDDRDARKTRQPAAGKAGRKYIFMVRTKVPGGKLTAGQLLAELDLGDRMGNGTLRITSRQGLQLHGVVKGNLWATVHQIDRALLTTLGACGDTSRNVMCCPAPLHNDGVHSAMQATANDIARHLAPQTRAYYEIWVDEEKVLARSAGDDMERLYGGTYLPRKFKIGIAPPEDNCIDVYTHDIGLLAAREAGELVGYNVLVGGGLGATPSVKETFPRLADPMAFVPYGDVLRVVTAIFKVQRDYGNREDRRRARMKYLVNQWGVPRFKAQVEACLDGEKLAEPRPLKVHGYDDHLGWRPQGDGRFYFGIRIENGRIKDEGACRMKTGLRRLLARFRMPARLTPGQNVLLYDLNAGCREEILAIAGEHGIRTDEEISVARRFSLACTALPTCGLAITEAERVMPGVIDRLESELARFALSAARFTIRMTGCPNGCARPYTSDIGLVGKAAGKYTIFVGGRLLGDRLNVLYKDMVPLEDVVEQLVPLLVYFKSARQEEESLGDFCHRKGVDELLRFDAEYSPAAYPKEERR